MSINIMSTINRILFPISGNETAIDYAIDLARQSNSKLYFLNTYLLTDMLASYKLGENWSIKHAMDKSLIEEFMENHGNKLYQSGIDFELKIEIGFLSDQILVSIKEHEINTLLIDQQNYMKNEPLVKMVNELKIPVMIIPNPAEK